MKIFTKYRTYGCLSGWNLGCYAWCVLSPLSNKIHVTRYRAIMWTHDFIHKTGSTLRIATPLQRRTGPRSYATCKNWWGLAVRFSSYANGRTDGQTDVSINQSIHSFWHYETV